MKCPVCDEQIENIVQKCPKCGFADLRTEFINENELEMWRTYVVCPCRFAYQTSLAQTKELQRKVQKELNAIKKALKESEDNTAIETGTNDGPIYKKPVLQKKAGWNTSGRIAYKNVSECWYHSYTRCEISNIVLNIVSNKATIDFFAKKVFDQKGPNSTTYISFKWKLKDDMGIIVADGQWANDRLNIGDVIKGTISISGLEPTIKYVLEMVDNN